MPKNRWRASRAYTIAFAAALSFVATGSAMAQSWPSKPIRVIVPLTAGSATDIIPRTIFEQLSAQLGQTITVENRVGGGGTIGAAAVAKADPDGYTLLVHSNAHVIAPSVQPNLSYDVVKDFAGIVPLGDLPLVMVVSPSKNFRTVQDLVAAAKAKPGSMNYASGGTGTAPHLTAERFRLSAGFEGTHIPFKGAPEALTEVMTGRVDFYFSPLLPALPFIRDGKLQVLAIGNSKRASALPGVPTTVEAGYANSDFDFWIGMFAPAKTPRDIVGKLHQEAVKALQNQRIQEKLKTLGVEPMIMTPEQFDARIVKDVATAAAIAKAVGIAVK